MPDSLRETLQERIREFLAAVTFETPDRINLTDEIKTLIAAHACLLLLGNIGGINDLKTIHVYRRQFRLHNDYWDFYFEDDEWHLTWDKMEEGLERSDSWNPLLFWLTQTLHRTTGWRGCEAAFEQWLKLNSNTSPRMNGFSNPSQVDTRGILFNLAVEFFEKPKAMHTEDSALYDAFREYFQVNPVEWVASRRETVGQQTIPDHWAGWLGSIRFYNNLPADQRSRLHQRILVILDEIEFVGDWRLEVTEEMKVTIAGQASFLLLGQVHDAFEGVTQVHLSSGSTPYLFDWEDGHLKLNWEKIQDDLSDPERSTYNSILSGFFHLLGQPSPSDRIPAINEAFDAYQKRERDRQLLGWEWKGTDSANALAGIQLAAFFQQPENVKHDVPAVYDAFREYFGMDPLAMLQMARDQQRIPFQPQWREIMKEHIGLYKILPKPLKEKLEALIPEFLAQVEFIPRDLEEITEQMKLTVATEACILILGRSMRDYRNLRTVEIWKGHPDNNRRIAGDAGRHRVRLKWEATADSARNASDNCNIVLHEFAHVIDNADDGEADSIPLPANDPERQKWEELIRGEQAAIRRSRYRDDKHLINEYGASNKAEFFTCATETFFEKPVELKRDHTDIYDTLQAYYQLDPATWESGAK